MVFVFEQAYIILYTIPPARSPLLYGVEAGRETCCFLVTERNRKKQRAI